MKRFMAILLALTLLLCSAVAFATVDNQEPTRQSDYFASYGTSLSAIGGGKIKVTFTCSAVGTAETLGVVNYIVQRKNSSGNWEYASGWLSDQRYRRSDLPRDVHIYLYKERYFRAQELYQRQQESNLKGDEAFRLDQVVGWADFQQRCLNLITVTGRGGLPPRHTKAMRGMDDDGECRRSISEMAGNR